MALFKRGDDIPAILKKLAAKSYKTSAEKRELLDTLAQLGELRSEDYVKFLTGADTESARWAMEQVGRVRNPRLVDQFLQALQHLPPARWKPLVLALHKLPSDRLSDRLGQMLKNKRAETRAAAMEVLSGHPRPREVLPLLKEALRDSDESIRVRAVQVMGQDTKASDVREILRDLFAHGDEYVRRAAIEALARDPDPGLIDPFFELLPNQPPKLQDLIIRGLKRMLANQTQYNEQVLECVLPLLSADDQQLRVTAAQLLAAMPDGMEVLRRFLQYSKGLAFWLRDRAFAAVSSVADDIVEAILKLMADEDVDVVVGAIFMSSDSRDPRLFTGLKGVLEADWDWWVKIPALERIANFDEPGVTEILLARLEDEDLCTCALAALGRRAQDGTLPHVLRFLAHQRRGLRRTALHALEHFKDPILVPSLEQYARAEQDGECRLMALELLDGLGAEGVATGAALRDELRIYLPDKDTGGLQLEMLKPDASQ